MFDRFGNEFDVGDKMIIFKCENNNLPISGTEPNYINIRK